MRVFRRLRSNVGGRTTVIELGSGRGQRRCRPSKHPTSRENAGVQLELRRNVPRTSSIVNNSLPPSNSARERRLVIRRNCNYLEAFLNFDYNLGLSPLRLNKNLDIKSSTWHKVFTLLYLIFALSNTLLHLSLKKAHMDKGKGNKIPLYVGWGFGLCLGFQRIMYWWNLWANQESFQKLFKSLQTFSALSLTHNERVARFVTALRVTSVLASATVAGFGLNLISRRVVRAQGWCFLDVFLAHEYEFQQAFPSITAWNVKQTMNESQHHLRNGSLLRSNFGFQNVSYEIDDECDNWNAMTTSFGIIGIIKTFAGYAVDTCPQDLLLLSALLLYQAMNSLQFEAYLSWLDEPADGTSDDDLKETFTTILTRYESIYRFTKSLNDIFEHMIPMMEMVGIGCLVDLMLNFLDGDWNGVVALVFRLIRLQVTFYFSVKVTKKFKKFQSWFVCDKTQEILQLDAGKVEMIKQELTINPIGIGYGPFYIDMKFVANFYTVTFTYFFLIGEAVADNGKD